MLLFSCMFLVTVSTISLWGYSSFSSESTKNYQEKLEQEARLVGMALEQRIERNFDVLKTTSAILPIDSSNITSKSMDELMSILFAIAHHNEVINAYVALKDGTTYSTSANGLVRNFNAKEKQREWYLRVFAGQDKVVTTPYMSAEGDAVMAVAVPVTRNGRVMAALVTNIKVDSLTKYISTLSRSNQIWVAREDGYLLAAKSPEQVGKNLFELRPSYKQYKDMKNSRHSYNFSGDDYFSVSSKLVGQNWSVWGWEPWSHISEASSNNLKSSVAISIVLIFVALLSLYLCIQKYIYLPLGDEPDSIVKVVKTIASGDLRQTSTRQEVGVYFAIMDMAEKLRLTLGQVQGVSSLVNSISKKIEGSATNVSENATRQMDQLTQTATAMNQMAETVSEVARSTSGASQAAQNALSDTSEGLALVRQVDRGIVKLNSGIQSAREAITLVEDESRSVGQIVDVIEEIAEQTNLLALNAAIEAARAGEQGRGFAVVADEVRNLASRTQSSTAKIQELIQKLQTESSRSVKLMQLTETDALSILDFSKQATQSLDTIQVSVSEIQQVAEQIATATEEQSVVASQINESISEINVMASQTQACSDENKCLAEELYDAANKLDSQLSNFKL